MSLSAFQAIDASFSQYLSEIYSPENTLVDGPETWQDFLALPSPEKISQGDVYLPLSLLDSIDGGRLQIQAEYNLPDSDPRLTAPSLPIVHYGRWPGMTQPALEAAHYINGVMELENGNTLDIRMVKVQLAYQLLLLSYDPATLDCLQMAFILAANKKRKFNTLYSVGGEVVEDITCELMDPHRIEFKNVTLDQPEGRIHGVTAELNIETYAIGGVPIEVPESVQWALFLDHRTDCESGICRVI